MAQLWDKSQKQWIKNFWLNLKNNNKNAGGKNYRKKNARFNFSFIFFRLLFPLSFDVIDTHALQTIYGSNTENGRQTIFFNYFIFQIF